MSEKRIEKVKRCIVDTLEKRGLINDVFLDLANQYCFLLQTIIWLEDDIRERGVTCEYQNGKDQWGYKKNDSVAEINRVSNQALKILQHLGIKPELIESIKEDDLEDEEM